MQASDRLLAWRYARAFFDAACARSAQDQVGDDLQACAQARLQELPALSDPRMAAADKKRLLRESLQGRVAPLTADILGLLLDEKRFNLLALVAEDFRAAAQEKRGVAKAAVRSARLLADAEQSRLRERLEAFCGRRVDLEVSEDPELLGGVVVRMGDWVLDGSLRGGLRDLREAIGGD